MAKKMTKEEILKKVGSEDAIYSKKLLVEPSVDMNSIIVKRFIKIQKNGKVVQNSIDGEICQVTFRLVIPDLAVKHIPTGTVVETVAGYGEFKIVKNEDGTYEFSKKSVAAADLKIPNTGQIEWAPGCVLKRIAHGHNEKTDTDYSYIRAWVKIATNQQKKVCDAVALILENDAEDGKINTTNWKSKAEWEASKKEKEEKKEETSVPQPNMIVNTEPKTDSRDLG